MRSKETKLHEAAVRYSDCLRKEVSPEPENASTFRAWDRLKRAARDYANALKKERP